MGRPRRPVAIAIATVIVLGGCGASATNPPPPASAALSTAPSQAASAPIATTQPSSSTAPSPAPSAPAASSGPVVLDSAVYPYSLTVPQGTLTLAWIPAQKAWDGTEAINLLGSPVVDKTGIPDGGLVIFGAPAPDGLDAFFQVHAANGTRYHGCSAPTGQQNVTINKVPAIAFVQSCAAQQTRAQVSIVHNGFGLGIFVSTGAGNQSVALEHLIDLLAGLTWKSG